MTWKELSDAILALSATTQEETAIVWPPVDCPAVHPVPVTGLGNLVTRREASGRGGLREECMQAYCQFCTRELYAGHDRGCPYFEGETMAKELQSLRHGMLLDAKSVMDDVSDSSLEDT